MLTLRYCGNWSPTTPKRGATGQCSPPICFTFATTKKLLMVREEAEAEAEVEAIGESC